jgi:hypothetical protein
MFNEDNVIPWTKQTYLDYEAISFSNRYFSNASKRSYLQAIPFTQEEDPFGKLAYLSGKGLVHAEDNIVQYFMLKDNN